jgi:hypothetical protein
MIFFEPRQLANLGHFGLAIFSSLIGGSITPPNTSRIDASKVPYQRVGGIASQFAPHIFLCSLIPFGMIPVNSIHQTAVVLELELLVFLVLVDPFQIVRFVVAVAVAILQLE